MDSSLTSLSLPVISPLFQLLLFQRIFQVSLFSANFFFSSFTFSSNFFYSFLISGRLSIPPSLPEEGLQILKPENTVMGLVWTVQLPSINSLNYCTSFRNKTEWYLSSLGTSFLCSIFGSYPKKFFSSFLFCHVGTYLNWDILQLLGFMHLQLSSCISQYPQSTLVLTSALRIPLRTPLSWAFKFFTKCHVWLPGQFFSSALGIFYQSETFSF